MRTLYVLILALYVNFFYAQQKSKPIATIEILPINEILTIKLSSPNDSITNWKVVIQDSKKTAIKTASLKRSFDHLEQVIPILDLLPGNYTCVLIHNDTLYHHQEFFKDANFSEPQTQPVLNKKH